MTAAPIPLEDYGVVIAYNDITERMQGEEALRQSMERLLKATNGIIDVIALSVETRDPYTAGHQRRVSSLACAIAQEINLPSLAIDNIRMAGIIHDIGKISVPAEILSKPTKLTDIEFSLIKIHPQSGYDILKEVELPYPIASIVLQHHERLNGSGYPHGLKGNQILLETNIIAVADVVEAISSHRPYRPAKGIDAALEEIEQNKGILYDAEVVEVCLKLFREKGFRFEGQGSRYLVKRISYFVFRRFTLHEIREEVSGYCPPRNSNFPGVITPDKSDGYGHPAAVPGPGRA